LVRVVTIRLDQVSSTLDEIEPAGRSVPIGEELKFWGLRVTEVFQYLEAGTPAVIEHKPVKVPLVRSPQLFLFHGIERIAPKEAD